MTNTTVYSAFHSSGVGKLSISLSGWVYVIPYERWHSVALRWISYLLIINLNYHVKKLINNTATITVRIKKEPENLELDVIVAKKMEFCIFSIGMTIDYMFCTHLVTWLLWFGV